MKNRTFIIGLFLSIILSLFINHKVFGNSNSTLSNIDIIEYWQHEHEKTAYSKDMAKYIYGRIKYYQDFEGDWYDKYIAFTIIYKALQEMDIE